MCVPQNSYVEALILNMTLGGEVIGRWLRLGEWDGKEQAQSQ